MDAIKELKRTRLMVLARGVPKDVLLKAVGAIKEAGVTVFESTFDHRRADCVAENAEKIAALVAAYGERMAIGAGTVLTVVPPEKNDGEVVCSTFIRGLIADGEVERANELLGARFGFSAEITHGRRLGRELGTPTLNMPLEIDLVVPKFGVYASLVTLESGERFGGVTNVGVKPTVGGTVPLWETWMPDYHGGEIYGQTADVRLLKFLRPEQKFDNLNALRGAILRDGEQAKAIFRQIGESAT